MKSTFMLLALLLSSNILFAQDWAGLNHFKDQNAQLPPKAQGEQRVVFMGNSITIGWLQTQPEFFENKPYVNRGISGQTTPQMVLRFRQDVVALDADVVVILAGTNDIAGNTGPMSLEMILDNMKTMVEIAQANQIKVVLCSVLPAYDYPWRPGLQPNVKIPQLNALLKAYAKEKNVHYLDYFRVLDDGINGIQKPYTYDGVHLTKEGYEIIAPELEKALKTIGVSI